MSLGGRHASDVRPGSRRDAARAEQSKRETGEHVLAGAGATQTDTEGMVEALTSLDLDGLRARWRTETGRHAPAHLSRPLLLRVLAYRMQATRHGDLDADTTRFLDRIGSGKGARGRVASAKLGKSDQTGDAYGPTANDGATSSSVARGSLMAAGSSIAAGSSASVPSELEGTSPRRRSSGEGVLALPDRALVRPGALLVREWAGETHRVMALADGFAWNRATYASLSEVARAITGTRWNGPRFFGLRARAARGSAGHGGKSPGRESPTRENPGIASPSSSRQSNMRGPSS